MKTKIVRMLKLLPVLIMAITFTSCDDVIVDVELDGHSSEYVYHTDYLCSRVWVDEWHDDYGVFYHQELRFFNDHCGEDFMYTEDRWGKRTETSYTFVWDWRNSRYNSIRLKYAPGDYSYMEHISMGGNELTCLFDGQEAYFTGR